MSKLRVAIIGCGMIANSAHFPALNILREEGLVEVIGVADIRADVAAETAKRHSVPNWYVDPQSLKTYNLAETQDPATAPTPTPSPEPAADANTVLYYNADGGERYHLDAYCRSANEKYLPFKGQFYYSQLTEDKYKELVACNVCGAPLRGQ